MNLRFGGRLIVCENNCLKMSVMESVIVVRVDWKFIRYSFVATQTCQISLKSTDYFD